MDTSQDDFVSLTFEKLFFPLLKTLQMAAVLRGRAVCPSPPPSIVALAPSSCSITGAYGSGRSRDKKDIKI